MAFNTGNPVPSNGFRDLSDNAENLDSGMNSDSPSFNDRLGNSRKSWAGMEAEHNAAQSERAGEFDASQADKEARFNSLLASSGWTGTGTGGAYEDYAPGVVITEYNQLIRFDDMGWRLGFDVELPYTVIGTTTPDDEGFVSVGDGALRQELSNGTPALVDAAIVGRGVVAVDSIADLLLQPQEEDKRYEVRGYYPQSVKGGGAFKFYDNYNLALHNGGTVISVAALSNWIASASGLPGGANQSNLFALLKSDLFDFPVSGTGPAFVRQSLDLSTYDFGLLFDDFSEDALDQFNSFVTQNEVSSALYAGRIKTRRKITLGNPVGASSLTRDITFSLRLDATHYSSDEEALFIDGFSYNVCYGDIFVTCGSSNNRQHRDGVRYGRTERTLLPSINITGVYRFGHLYTSIKSTLAITPKARCVDCGTTTIANALSYTYLGSSGSVSQSTAIELDAMPLRIAVGDIVKVGAYPTRVIGIAGNTLSVFPWVLDESPTIKVYHGAGVTLVGGDASLVTIDAIDCFRVSIALAAEPLYPPIVGTLHSNGTGIGVTIGGDRNAKIGGNIGNFYLEGGYDFSLVETSQAIAGFAITSLSGGTSLDNMYNIGSGGAQSITSPLFSWPRLQTKIITSSDTFVNSVGQPSNGRNAQDSSIGLGLKSYGDFTTWLRNSGTINLSSPNLANRLTGRDSVSVIIHGTGGQYQSTGTITINPPAGWTINGLGSLSLSGMTAAKRLTFVYVFSSMDIRAFQQDMAKI